MSILIKDILHNNQRTDIYIADDCFTQIEQGIDRDADTVIDGSQRAILPSFHNLHTHSAMTLMRGYADDMPLHTWLNDHIWPFESKLKDEDYYNGTRLACLEMIKSGTTYCADMYMGTEPVFRAFSEMGIRASVGSTFFDFFDEKVAAKMKLQLETDFDKFYNKNDKLALMPAPHAIYTVSEDSLRWLANFAQERDLIVNIHLSETLKEVEDCVEKYGMRPPAFLDKVGLLNENLLVAHAVHINDDEAALLAERGVMVAHCPASNMKLASGSFRYLAMADAGVKFSIATDGVCSDNNVDMMGEMKLAALRAKEMYGDATVAPAQDIYDRATKLPAQYMGLNTGEIAVGRKADFILVKLDDVKMVPNNNLISNMVYSATPEVIDYTVCDGNILMAERKVQGEEEIIAAVRTSMLRLNS